MVRPSVLPAALLAVLVATAGPVAPGEAPSASLRRAIDRVVERPALASALWGIEVRSLATGQVVYARNAEKDFTPASTLKLLTTAAALDAFGPHERARTTVETAGRLDALGRILGDVFLVGRGDASLAPAGLEELADQLAKAGLRRIEGRLVGHEGLFVGERRGADWTWGDLVWCYGAEVSALSFNDSCANLRVTPGERVGDPVAVDRSPLSAYYGVVSEATTSAPGTKSDLALARAAGSNAIRLSGTLPLGAPPEALDVALEDPARYAATVFAELLESRGVRVAGGVATSSGPLPPGLRVLASHDGPPMSEALKAVNKPSQNLHTEILLRLLGARVKGEGSVEKGYEAVREFLERAGAGSERWALQDASGLARSDLLAPHDLVSLLVAMDRHRHARAFRESLPIAGVDGSLEHRMKGTPAQGRIVAKTGGMRSVKALAGYATSARGARLAFAILVNNHTGPSADVAAAIDAIAEALVEEGPP